MKDVLGSALAIALLVLLVSCDPGPPGSNTNANRVFPTPSASVQPTNGNTSWEGRIRNEEQKLRDRKIVFNPPAEMKEQKTETIQARIAFEDIGAALSEGMRGGGQPQEESLKVSEVMKVTLTGDGDAFLIQKIGDEEQVVAGKEYAQWEWRVTPLQSGEQRLTLTATATIFLEGRGEKPIYYKTLEKPIVVKVDRWYSTKQFFKNNWQWLWAVIVVPAGGLLWRVMKKKKASATD
ncbi:MAG TPA: hypothetical protein VJS64_15485 [Pyrinomonadaceae bacterium]|nr:hypothetical protein [Pyrinomonadaceae bacterium]